jgi:hypothetical protein
MRAAGGLRPKAPAGNLVAWVAVWTCMGVSV